jgi:hypothetical protein
MIARRIKTMMVAGIGATIVMLASGASGQAAPVKLILSGHIGTGNKNSLPGAFATPEGVAASNIGTVYVAERGNHRVQELTTAGAFVLMFGKDVNETTGGDICTQEEIEKTGVKCKVGADGSAPGQFESPESVTVDPVSGDLFVAEYVFDESGEILTFGQRVQKFTADGKFLLEIGREVNTTTKANMCTAEEVEQEGVKCGGPSQRVVGTPYEWGDEQGSFDFEQGRGNLLVDGGPEDLLYVGDEKRVQEFKSDGTWKGEISSLPNRVMALTLDEGTGMIYLANGDPSVNSEHNIVREFAPGGEELKDFEDSSRQAGGEVLISGLALDPEGHLAITATEVGKGQFGSLYEASGGHRITKFAIPASASVAGIDFDSGGHLLAAASVGQEILDYKPVNVAELLTRPVMCAPGPEHETDATVNCTMNGEVNPYGVPGTKVWFQWGSTCLLGSETPTQSVPTGNAFDQVHAAIEGLKPNGQEFCYRLTGYDENVEPPEEALTSVDETFFTTPIVAPKVLGEPSVSFVKASSVVMFGEVNPENASTEYFFEYAPDSELLAKCPGLRKATEEDADCPGVAATPTAQSAVYGTVGASLEATGLQPDSVYRYRLFAEDENAKKTERYARIGIEGSFTTGAAPRVAVETGLASMVTATSAVVSGTLNGDGQAATYAFEVGIDKGALTQYGVVVSGTTGTGTGPVTKSLALTGLQPGTTYAYRIAISSGYVQNKAHTLYGAAGTFTTPGLPSVLSVPSVLTQLPIPRVEFPKEAAKAPPRNISRAQKLADALKACKKKSKRRRASCERSAYKRYGAKNKKG